MMGIKLTVIALLAGVVGFAGAAAFAADDESIPADKQAKMLQKHPEADANHDGKLTPEEWRAFRESHKPGGQAAAQPAEAGKAPANCPTKGAAGAGPHGGPGMMPPPGPVGVLDMILKHFDEIDTDQNGQLNKDELTAFKAKLIERGPAGGPRGFGGPGGPHGAEFAAELVKKYPEADTDKDGKLSPEEIKAFHEKNPGAMRQMFLEKHPDADTNKDGQLSDEEFNAAREKMHGQRRADRPGKGSRGEAPASK